jgi:hypothetical protein
MTLPASGNPISFSQINTELGRSSSATINMNDNTLRHTFNKYGSGTTIGMSDGISKDYVRWIGLRYNRFVSGFGNEYKVFSTIDGSSYTDIGTYPVYSSVPGYTAWNGLRMVAPGGVYHNKIAYTADGGYTWSTSTAPSTNYWSAVAYGNGYWVFGCGGSGATRGLYSSDNGVTWSHTGNFPATGFWNALTYTPNGFLAVSQDGYTAYSSTGATWTASTTLTKPSGGAFTDVGYGNGYYLICCPTSAGVSIFRSTNGTSWSEVTIAGIDYGFQAISYAGGSTWFLTGGTTGSPPGYRSTDNGATWNVISTNTVNSRVLGVTFINNTRAVATGVGTPGASAYLQYTSDSGANWTATLATDLHPNGIFNIIGIVGGSNTGRRKTQGP